MYEDALEFTRGSNLRGINKPPGTNAPLGTTNANICESIRYIYECFESNAYNLQIEVVILQSVEVWEPQVFDCPEIVCSKEVPLS